MMALPVSAAASDARLSWVLYLGREFGDRLSQGLWQLARAAQAAERLLAEGAPHQFIIGTDIAGERCRQTNCVASNLVKERGVCRGVLGLESGRPSRPL